MKKKQCTQRRAFTENRKVTGTAGKPRAAIQTATEVSPLHSATNPSCTNNCLMQIILTTISYVGARWDAAVNKGNTDSLMRNAVMHNDHNDMGKLLCLANERFGQERNLVECIVGITSDAARAHCE